MRFVIAVHNTGPSLAAGVTVTDELPAGLRLASKPDRCTIGQKITCAVGRTRIRATIPIRSQSRSPRTSRPARLRRTRA
ncbi:hypothetical protein ACQPYH_09160 [Kribbella sp. CA-245084]|uniref:hypothetical protein n=1 Tax=Kribbella sp. CA-245084 TaxID=3239940 RepID=UPI003D92DE69